MDPERPRSEPEPRAVALSYDPAAEPGAAPRVVAAGSGERAARILALAAEHGVPVRRDVELCELLAGCDLGQEIPLELYAAVAEVLAFLLRANEAAGA